MSGIILQYKFLYILMPHDLCHACCLKRVTWVRTVCTPLLTAIVKLYSGWVSQSNWQASRTLPGSPPMTNSPRESPSAIIKGEVKRKTKTGSGSKAVSNASKDASYVSKTSTCVHAVGWEMRSQRSRNAFTFLAIASGKLRFWRSS